MEDVTEREKKRTAEMAAEMAAEMERSPCNSQ
jgi:hypothetical protein